MKKETSYNQKVNVNGGAPTNEGNPSCEGASCDNMTEPQDTTTDNVTEAADKTKVGSAPERNLEAEISEWKDKYIRLQAEFDNFRRRTLREKMDLVESGGSNVLKSMLNVLDDVLRAVEASEKSDDIAALREGERLVAQKFIDTLRQHNVTEIEALDKEFDADHHEAVSNFEAGEDKKGKVIGVVQRGYMLGGKVLRYAKVVVGK